MVLVVIEDGEAKRMAKWEFEALTFSVLADWDPPSQVTSSEFCNSLMTIAEEYYLLEEAGECLSSFCTSCSIAKISDACYLKGYLAESKTQLLFYFKQRSRGPQQQHGTEPLRSAGLSLEQMSRIAEFWELAPTLVDPAVINQEVNEFCRITDKICAIKIRISEISTKTYEALEKFTRHSPSVSTYIQIGAEFCTSLPHVSGEQRSIADSFTFSHEHDVDTGRRRNFVANSHKDVTRNIRLILTDGKKDILKDILSSWYSYYLIVRPSFRNLSLLQFSERVFAARGGGDPIWWRVGWSMAAEEFGLDTTFDSVFTRLP